VTTASASVTRTNIVSVINKADRTFMVSPCLVSMRKRSATHIMMVNI
jgi:hypothetical protein